MEDKRRFSGRNVIVTGAASGLGGAMARAFAKEGANVVALDIGQPDDPDTYALQLHCDVSDEAAVADAIDRCIEKLGQIDIVCNNAGIVTLGQRLHEISIDQWDKVIAVNLRGVFLIMKHAIGRMIHSGGGVIINTSSTSALRVRERTGAYGPAKSAVLRLTELAAIEYASDGIRVNAICPGPIETAIFADVPAEDREAMARVMPLGRMGQPEEVAALCTFLASDEAAFMTGGSYLIDGGRVHV